jgi:hypothetical protein
MFEFPVFINGEFQVSPAPRVFYPSFPQARTSFETNRRKSKLAEDKQVIANKESHRA